MLQVPGVMAGTEGLPVVVCGPEGAFPWDTEGENPIRKARVAAGITQQDLAVAMGVSQPMLSKLERGGRAVRPRSIAKVQKAIEALLRDRLRRLDGPMATFEDLEEANQGLLRLGLARKRRDPEERGMLLRAGDPLAALETERRVKVAGERAVRRRRPGGGLP